MSFPLEFAYSTQATLPVGPDLVGLIPLIKYFATLGRNMLRKRYAFKKECIIRTSYLITVISNNNLKRKVVKQYVHQKLILCLRCGIGFQIFGRF